LPDTAETPLHSAICRPNNPSLHQVVEVLVKNGANPNAKTISGIETGSFMRDCRTKGETPLHRAAAFASEDVIDILCEAGARLDLADVNGDTALTWASWYGRPTKILRKLCFGSHRVHAERKSMADVLVGSPVF
jgi:ankyrin repeat protein